MMSQANPQRHIGHASGHALNSYPIQHLGPTQSGALVAFILGVDERIRTARFHRHMTADMVRNYYRTLDWDNAVIAAWVSGGTIYGVCEGHLFQGSEGLQAEVALCVDEDLHGRRVGQALMQSVISTVAGRGACRTTMILHRDDRAHAVIVRQLDAMVDWQSGTAILQL